MTEANPYRALPKVDDLLDSLQGSETAQALNKQPRSLIVAAVREDLEQARALIRDQGLDGDAVRNFYQFERFQSRLELQLKKLLQKTYIGAINATGVVLHTGLGRAVLPEAATEALINNSGFSILEVDRKSGKRNRREDGISRLLNELCQSPAATVVNNNAAATMISLAALARGKEVIVARGQLVEIGGSYRIPDVMEESGAKLREVGTTNKVRISDYENAINENTGLILRVHTSNFQVQGFTSEVPTAELCKLGHKHNVMVMDDLGSGALFDLSPYGLSREPLVHESLASGAAVVTFSGDKLLGGPQAGLIVGIEEAVEKIKKHSLYRAMRPDKLILSALEATLQLYRDAEQARSNIPVLAMLTCSIDDLELRSKQYVTELGNLGVKVELQQTQSMVGGGAYAVETMASLAVTIVPNDGLSIDEIQRQLRMYQTPIFTRCQQGRLWLDLRTILPKQDNLVIAGLKEILGNLLQA